MLSVGWTEDDDRFIAVENLQRIGYGIIAPTILGIGVVGGLANMVTLSNRKKFRGRFYTYIRQDSINSFLIDKECDLLWSFFRALAMVDFAVISVSVFGMLSTLTSNIYESPFREYFVTTAVDLGQALFLSLSSYGDKMSQLT